MCKAYNRMCHDLICKAHNRRQTTMSATVVITAIGIAQKKRKPVQIKTTSKTSPVAFRTSITGALLRFPSPSIQLARDRATGRYLVALKLARLGSIKRGPSANKKPKSTKNFVAEEPSV